MSRWFEAARLAGPELLARCGLLGRRDRSRRLALLLMLALVLLLAICGEL